jgi:DNA-binding PadR family transcriptional regulator
MIEAEWGVSENNRRAKFYSLTARGRQALRVEAKSWHRFADAIAKVLDAPRPQTA